MRFHDREDAGGLLGAALSRRGVEQPVVVLGIPRGGIPVAAEVARALRAPLGVVVSRKIGAPGNPEVAIGATTANGATYMDPRARELIETAADFVEAERGRQIREARRRERLFPFGTSSNVTGHHALVVDDGLATGATAIAALRSLKTAGARRVTLAVPVAASSTLDRLAEEADEVLCLHADPDFMAVGQYYDDFTQVTDEEARAILDEYRAAGRTA
jgi:predicted phosphoribosyltransferase